MRVVERRDPGPVGRDYIEMLSESDRVHQVNSMGTLAARNAWGEIMAEYSDGSFTPVTCGHGGSM